MEILFYILIWSACGALVGHLASKKGRSALGWGVFGFMLFIVALPCILIIGPLNQRQCPFCMSNIPMDATVCAHCQKDLG